MKVFLLPSLKSPYEPVVQLARRAADKDTIITDNFKKIEKLLRSKKVSKIVIIMGAGNRNPLEAFNLLRKIDPGSNISVVDGWNWGIPGQIFLPKYKSTVKLFKKALMS